MHGRLTRRLPAMALALALVACGEAPPPSLEPSPASDRRLWRVIDRDTAPSAETEATVLRLLPPVASRLIRQDWGVPDASTPWALRHGAQHSYISGSLTYDSTLGIVMVAGRDDVRGRARRALHEALVQELGPTVRPNTRRAPPAWRGIDVRLSAHGDTVRAMILSIGGRACGTFGTDWDAVLMSVERHHLVVLVRDGPGSWRLASGPVPRDMTSFWYGPSPQGCLPVARDSTFHERLLLRSEVAR